MGCWADAKCHMYPSLRTEDRYAFRQRVTSRQRERMPRNTATLPSFSALSLQEPIWRYKGRSYAFDFGLLWGKLCKWIYWILTLLSQCTSLYACLPFIPQYGHCSIIVEWSLQNLRWPLVCPLILMQRFPAVDLILSKSCSATLLTGEFGRCFFCYWSNRLSILPVFSCLGLQFTCAI